MHLYRRTDKQTKEETGPIWVKFEHRGVVVRQSTKTTNRVVAQRVANAIYNKHVQRAHGVLVDDDTDVKAVTLKTLTAEYVDFATRDHPATVDDDARVLARFTEIVGGGETFIHTITSKTIKDWRVQRCQDTTRRGTPVTPAAVNRELNVVRAMFREAVSSKYLKASPCAGVKDFKVTDKEIHVLSARELQRAFTMPAPFNLFCEVTYRSLSRLSEVVNMRVEHVTITRRSDGQQIATMTKRVKGGKWKVVRIDLDLAKRLRACVTSDEQTLLFPQHAHVDGHSTTILRHLRALGIRRASHHTFRHTGITRMLEMGVSPRAIQEHAGWSSLKQLQRYGHVLDREFARAVEATGDFLKAATEETQEQSGGVA
jgi:integrase